MLLEGHIQAQRSPAKSSIRVPKGLASQWDYERRVAISEEWHYPMLFMSRQASLSYTNKSAHRGNDMTTL